MNKKLSLKNIHSGQIVLATLIALLLIVGLLVTTPSSVSAEGSPEWTFVSIPDLPQGASIGKIWIDSPTNVYVWAEVGSIAVNPEAYLYHWNGSTWVSELAFPGFLYGRIHGNSADDIFVSVSACTADVCGDDERPLIYHFDGDNWQEQVVPPEVGGLIRTISGVPGEVQATTYGTPTRYPEIIIRYDDSSETWSQVYLIPEYKLLYVKAMFILSADEAYYTACNGHGRWNGSEWESKIEFDFCDLSDLWGTRDGQGQLHLYTVGKNNYSNGVRVWKYTENANPELLGTFGSKCGFVFGDPADCTGLPGSPGIGGAYGVWGSAWNDVYVVGSLGYDLETSGRVYRYDGQSWQQITVFGEIPRVNSVGGSGPDDVWIGLRDGRLLHYGILNTAPELTVDNAVTSADEGQSATIGGTVSDVDGDTVALSSSEGTVINNGDGTWSWNFPTSDGPIESQTVTIAADDGNGGSATASFELVVNNVAPTIDAITAPVVPVNIDDQPISVEVTFSDPGVFDTHTVIWDWDDESSDTQTETNSPAEQTHIFNEAGIYTVQITVTDDDGGEDTASYQYVVIYDPEGGFVTGGGWIYSPPGAYTPDTEVEGFATFGFVSKYLKGREIPEGETEFHFNTASGIKFHSTSYDWLVIAPKYRARFQGYGTVWVNEEMLGGEGDYRFILTTIDGALDGTDQDKFRIRIWEDGGGVIYDNEINEEDGEDPTTVLESGSIIIFTTNWTTK